MTTKFIARRNPWVVIFVSKRRSRLEKCENCGDILIGFTEEEEHDCDP